jgi:hypothetical protein
LGRYTQSEGEALELLLVNHFPNSVVNEEVAAPAAAPNVWTGKWLRGRRVEWAIDSSDPYKSPDMEGIFPALLQEGWRTAVPYLVKSFCAYLVNGYIPAIWSQVKAVFITKPDRKSYKEPQDF